MHLAIFAIAIRKHSVLDQHQSESKFSMHSVCRLEPTIKCKINFFPCIIAFSLSAQTVLVRRKWELIVRAANIYRKQFELLNYIEHLNDTAVCRDDVICGDLHVNMQKCCLICYTASLSSSRRSRGSRASSPADKGVCFA